MKGFPRKIVHNLCENRVLPINRDKAEFRDTTGGAEFVEECGD